MAHYSIRVFPNNKLYPNGGGSPFIYSDDELQEKIQQAILCNPRPFCVIGSHPFSKEVYVWSQERNTKKLLKFVKHVTGYGYDFKFKELEIIRVRPASVAKKRWKARKELKNNGREIFSELISSPYDDDPRKWIKNIRALTRNINKSLKEFERVC